MSIMSIWPRRQQAHKLHTQPYKLAASLLAEPHLVDVHHTNQLNRRGPHVGPDTLQTHVHHAGSFTGSWPKTHQDTGQPCSKAMVCITLTS